MSNSKGSLYAYCRPERSAKGIGRIQFQILMCSTEPGLSDQYFGIQLDKFNMLTPRQGVDIKVLVTFIGFNISMHHK